LPSEPDRLLEPIRIFENLYYFGFSDVGAWAIPTSEGIILFDTLNSGDEARDVLVAGLKKIGLDPAQIKYVIVGHAHNDHTGGGRYLQSTYGPRMLMGGPDWDTVVTSQRPDRAVMKRDTNVTDGQKLTLGDTTVTLGLTPGHTPGTIAMETIGRQYPSGPHPFLLGPKRFSRYLDIMLECGRARLAAFESPAS
jgi:metallo-beta-lactamase class B